MPTEVNHKEMKKHIKKCYIKGRAVFIKGKPGIGKSEGTKEVAMEIAQELNMPFNGDKVEEGKFSLIDIRMSQYAPEDLKGLPSFDKINKVTEWLHPEVLPKTGCGIMFLDEFNLAAPSIQASGYQLILDGKIGTYTLPKGWLVIAAGNGLNDRCGTYDMSDALKNRFSHIELTPPNIDEWTKWAVPHNINNLIISYLQFKKSHLFCFDANSNDDAWASPRSWAFASDLIEGETNDKDIQRGIASCVGEGVARELMAFHKMRKEVNIKEIIKHSKEFKSPKEISIRYAIAGALAEEYNNNPKVLQNLCEIWQKFEPEFTVVSIKMCMAYKPLGLPKELLKLKEWDKLSSDYAKYLN